MFLAPCARCSGLWSSADRRSSPSLTAPRTHPHGRSETCHTRPWEIGREATGECLAIPPLRDRPPSSRRGACLLRYAQESSWREDHRRVSNGEQWLTVAGLALAHPV